MKKWLISLITILILIPSVFVFAQDFAPTPTIEITGANASELPVITITSNVLDSNNLPVPDLTIDDFTLGGDLEGLATIVSVENITADNLPFATVLLIDTSTSMSGLPLQQAKEAASLFIQSVGENDPIAIVTFNSRTRLVQDYTTDKDLLLTVIDGLQVTGRTALYDAAVLGVEVAANAPVPRRAVILLSDGAEFGGESLSIRGDGLTNAIQNGVSLYTVGLGFGTDRSFLQELAEGSNARNYESPTPAELTAIYAELATLFRTQYVVTLESDIPSDGTVYEFTLQSDTPQGATNVDTGTIRAPIPVPIVNLDDNLFTVPFSSPVTISPTITADDEISDSLVTVNGEAIDTNPDGSFIIDPIAYPPATYALEVTVTDVDGDVGSDRVDFETAALASAIILDFESGTVISEPTTITISADGQTPAINASYTITNGTFSEQVETSDAENGFPITIDPYLYGAGDYDLVMGVENEGGASSNLTVPFTIESLPPSNIRIEGIDSSVDLSAPTEFSITADTQVGAELEDVSVTIVGQDAPLEDLIIRPASLRPGTVNLDVTVTDSNGIIVTEIIPITIASLPPSNIRIEGIDSSVDLSEPTEFSITADTQAGAELEDVSVTIVGQDAPLEDLIIRPASLQPGTVNLDVTVTDSNGTIVTEIIPITIASLPPQIIFSEIPDPIIADTVIAVIIDSQTDLLSVVYNFGDDIDIPLNPLADGTYSGIPLNIQMLGEGETTIVVTATNSGGTTATETLIFNIALPTPLPNLAQTAEAGIAQTSVAATTEFIATNDAQSTSDAQDARATNDAQEAEIQATSDAQSASDAQDAQATSDAQSTSDAQDAQATSDAQSTSDAQDAQATNNAQDAQATSDAQQAQVEETQARATTVAQQANVQATQTTIVAASVEPTATVTPTETEVIIPTATLTEIPQATELPVTLTPVEIIEVGAQSSENPPLEGNLTGIAICGGAILLVLILAGILFFGRGKNGDERA